MNYNFSDGAYNLSTESGFNLNEDAENLNNSSARIDEVAKYLFEISDPILIDFLNGVFHLNLNREHTTVISCKNEYPNTEFSVVIYFVVDNKYLIKHTKSYVSSERTQ